MQHQALRGLRVLIAEDQYVLADDLQDGLRAAGAQVVGPVGSVEEALDLASANEALDGALLDVNLRGEMVYPVADVLLERRIRIVFVTGYDQEFLPQRYAEVTRCVKPLRANDVVAALEQAN